MRILIIQNDTVGPPGILGDVINARNADAHTIMPTAGEHIPGDHQEYDGLVVLGGTMSANDTQEHPYLHAAFASIHAFAAESKPVLGICLGAQMIARAFAQPVAPLVRGEVGFKRLIMTEAALSDPLLTGLDAEQHVMQWHEEGFALPAEATLLMTGDTVENQVYRMGEAIYGFQCHPEVNADIVQAWMDVASQETMAAHPEFFANPSKHIAAHIEAATAFGSIVFDRWISLVESQRSLE